MTTLTYTAVAMYAFKDPLKRFAAYCIDLAGGLVFRNRPKPFPREGAVVVLRLDQLGDVVMAAYFLRELRRALPERKIIAVTGAGGGELLKSLLPDDSRMVFDADWFGAKPSFLGSLQTWFRLKRLLALIDPAAVIDLRGDLRHILAARISCPRAWIAGTCETGGAFMLDAVVRPVRGTHALQKNMAFFPAMSIEAPQAPSAVIPLASEPLAEKLMSGVPVKTGKWIALHPGAGTDAKLWPDRHWCALLGSLPLDAGTRFFWIGDAHASAHVKRISAELDPALASCFMDLTAVIPLSQLGTFLRGCDLLISTDSGPAHLAAAQDIPVVVAFSGTSDPEEWRPLGSRSRTVDHRVGCSPCGLKHCPLVRRDCMEDLEPERVAGPVRELLSCGARA